MPWRALLGTGHYRTAPPRHEPMMLPFRHAPTAAAIAAGAGGRRGTARSATSQVPLYSAASRRYLRYLRLIWRGLPSRSTEGRHAFAGAASFTTITDALMPP